MHRRRDPGLLYYACLFIHVDLEAAKHKIGAAKIDDEPGVSEVLKSGWHFLVPIAFLVFALIYPDITHAHAGKGGDRRRPAS